MYDPSGKTLLQLIRSWQPATAMRVAFSGGVDSTVLLHLLAGLRSQLPGPLSAFHVNHNLHGQSQSWDSHCRAVCEQWGMGYESFNVDARPIPGRSPEDWARQLRYASLENNLALGELLVTAHHQDDQMETMLLQLFRGAGPAGLAGMPAWRTFGAGAHGRPLLGWSRSEIKRYASEHNLPWVEDHTNADTGFDRNFVRAELLPALQSRWSGVGATLSRAAELQAEASTVLREVAELDLAACRGASPQRLRLVELGRLSWPRQANVLRHWLASLSLPAPAHVHVQEMRLQLLESRPDSAPKVTWPGAEVRRFADELWAGPPLPARDAREQVPWCLREPCQLVHGQLQARAVVGAGMRRSALSDDLVEVRFRSGGEAILPMGDRHHRLLKKLLQQANIPPWMRARLPLLFLGDHLVAVADLWLDAGVAAAASEPGWEIIWRDNAA